MVKLSVVGAKPTVRKTSVEKANVAAARPRVEKEKVPKGNAEVASKNTMKISFATYNAIQPEKSARHITTNNVYPTPDT